MVTHARPLGDTAPLIRRAIQADALFVTASSTLFIAAAGQLEAMLAIPAAYLALLGIACLLYAGLLFYIASRPAIDPRLVWMNIAVAAVWVVGSIVLLFGGLLPLTPAGWWLVAGIALAVDALAVAQYIGLRQAR
jgi:low temperature requirement protein LtrA